MMKLLKKYSEIYDSVEGSDCWFSDEPKRFLGKKYDQDNYIKSNGYC